MKNLKKVLAFVLVVAMMASITISASALAAKDFTDYTEVQNKDAVAMLTELSVINGYPTGDFKPAGTVTRAEMAKMIYVILNAGKDSAPAPDAQRYTDVWDGMWCEGYVAFCDDLGIIAGYGDGKFGPSDTVTGTQAAKMLLVAMGYDPAKEGFTGTNWDYNVLKVASAAGLFEGFNASVSEGCTRDNAALLIYNALIGDEVSYIGDTVVENGKTLLGEYFGVVAMTGVVVANEYANLFDTKPLRAGYTEIAFIGDQYIDDDQAIDPIFESFHDFDFDPGSIIAGDTVAGQFDDEQMGYGGSKIDAVDGWDQYDSFIFSSATTLDQIGTTVTVFAKLKGNYEEYYVNKVAYDEYDLFSGKIVGNVVDKGGLVKTYDGTSFEEFDYKALKSEGITFDSNTRYFVNYALSWSDYGYPSNYVTDPDVRKGYAELDDKSAIEYNAPGEITKVYDNDGDGVAELVLKTRDFFAQAIYDKYLETWDFKVAADPQVNDNIDFDDDENGFVDYFEEVPEDVVVSENGIDNKDFVLVKVIDGNFYVEKAASIEEECSKVSWGDEDWDYVTLGGEKYIESGIYWANDAMGPDPDTVFDYDIAEMEKKTTYTCYLDAMGNIVAYYDSSEKVEKAVVSVVLGSYYDYHALKNYYQLLIAPKNESKLYLLDVDQDKYGLPASDSGPEDFTPYNNSDFFMTDEEEQASTTPGGNYNGAWYYASQYFATGVDNHFYNMITAQLEPGFIAETGDSSTYYPYGIGEKTALVKAYYTSDEDDDYTSVSVAAFDDDTIWHIITDSYVENGQDEFSVDGDGVLYADKNTVFFVCQYVPGSGRDEGKVDVKVESFTGVKNLKYVGGITQAYAIEGVKGPHDDPSGIASYVVFETEENAKPVADAYAYVIGARNSDVFVAMTSEGKLVEFPYGGPDGPKPSSGTLGVVVDGKFSDKVNDYDTSFIGYDRVDEGYGSLITLATTVGDESFDKFYYDGEAYYMNGDTNYFGLYYTDPAYKASVINIDSREFAPHVSGIVYFAYEKQFIGGKLINVVTAFYGAISNYGDAVDAAHFASLYGRTGSTTDVVSIAAGEPVAAPEGGEAEPVPPPEA